MTEEKRQAILDAVNAVKKGPFKATAIKVELEAQMFRNQANPPSDSEQTECNRCAGSGFEDVEAGCECEEEHIPNGDCHGDDCYDCNGSGRNGNGSWNREVFCQDWIFKKLADLNLTELRPENHDDQIYHRHLGSSGKYIEKGPLVYGEFYRDGSVDSEFTFTILLDNPENVFLLPKIVQIFKDMGTEMGTEMDVNGAGMHTAFVNHENGFYGDNYPTRTSEQLSCFNNFKRSMILLLPALYFLATTNDQTRQLSYRIPRISEREKYSAIAYRFGAVEFRIFDTCYDNPEQILDHFVTMKNCMRYWSTKLKVPKMGVRSIRFGTSDSADNKLERLYMTADHLKILNAGLVKIKPSYSTIKELKKQRKFTVDRKRLVNIIEEQQRLANTKYREYEERFSLLQVARRNRLVGQMLERQAEMHRNRLLDTNVAELMAEAERQAEAAIATEQANKQPIEQFVRAEINNFNERCRGAYQLQT